MAKFFSKPSDKLKVRSLFLVFIFSISLTAFSQETNKYTIEVTTPNLSFRDDANFVSDRYVKGSLGAGDKAEVLGIKNFSYGSGVQVKITTPGPNQGKIGWVYYSKTEAKRLIKMKKNGEDINPSSSNFFSILKEIDSNLNTQASNLAEAKSLRQKPTDESINDVWKNIYNGNYIIDSAGDDGGKEFPVIRKWEGKDGLIHTDRVYVPRSYDRLVGVFDNYLNGLDISTDACREPSWQKQAIELERKPVEVLSTETNEGVTPGCEFLENSATSWTNDKMMTCFDNIRNKLHPGEISGRVNSSSKESYNKVLKGLFKLAPEEREFMGAVLTGYGEGRSQSDEEVFLILKTFENRKEIAQRSCPNADILDVALQSKQYSMWNYKIRRRKKGKTYYYLENWKKAVSVKEEDNGEKAQFKRLINIYRKYKNNEYKTTSNVEKVTHYRTRAMGNVYWGHTSDSIPTIKVNNKELGRNNTRSGLGTSNIAHYFFTSGGNRGYAYSSHPFRKEIRSCY